MLYIDTCVLLAVLTPEAHSATATAFLAEASAPLAISSWSVTELHSALGLKVRTKALTQAQAEAVLQGYERSLAPGLLVLELESQDFRNANACLRGWSTSLRAADALHLAIASGRGATLCRQCFDLGEFIAEQYVQLVRGAADDEAKLNALAGLTSACSKLKLRHLSFDP
ncbi:type II toxin-antitoxin system VapC family toxin [Synechococcus sp. BSF8S]|uniref:type II toxin-antitoxin system VapC family toxin n=1 Tax=Synechococcales TaxID=1890424 RepID=UPI0016297AB4|nr:MULTISPECIES: type II toxin-antitoxin system VapC family toxin [unclassified Synechococcus]MBC1262373.1 type II toxin-antitoxin system VapC family toxin [Synechococcus sp. BSF8S]MBC1265292.1 type II toxin-antitoxin system VapC family toxin [Synechococcus sp. BSA11S]